MRPAPRKREIQFESNGYSTEESVRAFLKPQSQIVYLLSDQPIIFRHISEALHQGIISYELIAHEQRLRDEDGDWLIDEFGGHVYYAATLDIEGRLRDMDLRYQTINETDYDLLSWYGPLIEPVQARDLQRLSRMGTRQDTVTV
jgi:hypothetical protein